MDLPAFRRGFELVSSDLNKLSNAIRASSVTAVIGGTFNRTPGGTTIIVNDQVRGGEGGGGTIPCPFQISDVSTSTEMKVEVAWGLVWQMLPTGMVANNKPTLKITISETCFVYSAIVFDTDTLLPDEVKFVTSAILLQNTQTTQYNLVAIVTVSDEQKKTIIGIRNICQQPFPSPCSLA